MSGYARPSLTLLAGTMVVAFVGGCGSRELVHVEGRVQIAGSPPSEPGHLFFVPREMSTNLRRDHAGPRPGSARFGRDGGFRAGTFHEGDGLRPGIYEVRIECSAKPVASHDAPTTSLVPDSFRAPDLVVPATRPRSVRYELDVP